MGSIAWGSFKGSVGRCSFEGSIDWGSSKSSIERGSSDKDSILKGSWDLVTRVIIRVAILITPIKVLITLLTKSHDPPSRMGFF